MHERAAAYVESMDYVTARCTGRITATRHSTTCTNCCDNRVLDPPAYDDELVKLAGVDATRLPPLIAIDGAVGPLLSEVARELGLPGVCDRVRGHERHRHRGSCDRRVRPRDAAASRSARRACWSTRSTSSGSISTTRSSPCPARTPIATSCARRTGSGARCSNTCCATSSTPTTSWAITAPPTRSPPSTARSPRRRPARAASCSCPGSPARAHPRATAAMRGGFVNMSLETTAARPRPRGRRRRRAQPPLAHGPGRGLHRESDRRDRVRRGRGAVGGLVPDPRRRARPPGDRARMPPTSAIARATALLALERAGRGRAPTSTASRPAVRNASNPTPHTAACSPIDTDSSRLPTLLFFRSVRRFHELVVSLRHHATTCCGACRPRDARRDSIIAELEAFAHDEDKTWETGKCSGTMYCGDHTHYEFLGRAFELFAHMNALAARHVPEHDEVRGRDHRHDARHAPRRRDHRPANPSASSPRAAAAASCTRCSRTGSSRNRPRGIDRPNFVKPETAHPAFDKACHLLAVECRRAPIDPKTMKADVDGDGEAHRREHDRDRRFRVQLRLRHHRPRSTSSRISHSTAGSACTSTVASAASSCRGARSWDTRTSRSSTSVSPASRASPPTRTSTATGSRARPCSRSATSRCATASTSS